MVGIHETMIYDTGPPGLDMTKAKFVERIKIHPRYEKDKDFCPHRGGCWNNDYDFALLKLTTPIEFNKAARPICLPASASTMYEGKWAKAAGWGSATGNIICGIISVCPNKRTKFKPSQHLRNSLGSVFKLEGL